MRGRKKIRRCSGQKRVMYFNKDTEVSIVKFLGSQSDKERERVYRKEILPAMKKLIESLIYVYGFRSPLMNTSELIEEGCFFLFKSLHKWDPERGSKAFSYFNVVGKRFLINTVNSHRKKYFKHVYLDDILTRNNSGDIRHSQGTDLADQLKNMYTLPSTEELMINGEHREENLARVKRIRDFLTEDRDLVTISAVENLFAAATDLEFFNKQSIYIYLSEISGLDKKHLRKSMSKIRKIYARLTVEDREKEETL